MCVRGVVYKYSLPLPPTKRFYSVESGEMMMNTEHKRISRSR